MYRMICVTLNTSDIFRKRLFVLKLNSSNTKFIEENLIPLILIMKVF